MDFDKANIATILIKFTKMTEICQVWVRQIQSDLDKNKDIHLWVAANNIYKGVTTIAV